MIGRGLAAVFRQTRAPAVLRLNHGLRLSNLNYQLAFRTVQGDLNEQLANLSSVEQKLVLSLLDLKRSPVS